MTITTGPERPLRQESSEQLNEIERKTRDDQSRLKSVPRRFRLDAHRTIDESVMAASERCNDAIRSNVYDLAHAAGTAVRLPAGFGEDWLLATNPDIARRWHEAVDADKSNFAAFDRPEYEARRDALAGVIEAVQQERDYRRLEAQRAEAEAVLGTTSSDRCGLQRRRVRGGQGRPSLPSRKPEGHRESAAAPTSLRPPSSGRTLAEDAAHPQTISEGSNHDR